MLIDREEYLEKLIALTQADAVVVITGVRRCGKSSLLNLYAKYLLGNSVDEGQIIRINFESARFENLRESNAFHEYIDTYIQGTNFDHYYLLIDEAQEIDKWAQVINSLRVSFPLTICVTGSNSKLFAGEDLTYLAGRYVELEMLPLSLKDYETFRLASSGDTRHVSSAFDSASSESLFQEYLSFGSFPAVALANRPEVRTALLQGIVDSVMVRDVVSRGRVDNESAFIRVAQYVFDTIGCLSSARKIANTLASSGRKIAINTVDRYLNLMCDAFVLYECPRYDIKGKEYLVSTPKYYVVDMGLRNIFLGERPCDLGHILENLVYLELRRRGYEVAVGRIDKKEIDFVATHQNDRLYVQVAQTLLDDSTYEREFASLMAIKDAYPKYLMSLDEIDHSSQGIRHIKIQDFLRGASI